MSNYILDMASQSYNERQLLSAMQAERNRLQRAGRLSAEQLADLDAHIMEAGKVANDNTIRRLARTWNTW